MDTSGLLILAFDSESHRNLSMQFEQGLVKKEYGQNQHVYEFDKSGLQVWVWRNKIRTVIISNSVDDENE